MSSPLESPEFRDNDPDTPDGLYVGDTKDDDGQVLDSQVMSVDRPAEPVVEAIRQVPLEQPKKITRLITGTRVISPGDSPMPILTPDAKRLSLKMLMTTPTGSATATDYVNFADNSGNVSQALATGAESGCTRIRAWAVDHTLDGHTGAVWIAGSLGQTLPLELTWVAVTS